MLGFSPLASAPLASDSDRVRADLEGRLAGAINFSGSAHANASVRSEGAAVLGLAAISSGFCANAAAINGASAASGSASAKVKLNSSASAAVGITGDGIASARLKARSLSFWDAGGLSHAGVATRAALSEEFLVARAASADVEAIGGVSTSVLFVLNAAVMLGSRATAAGGLALAGSAVSATVVKPVLVTSVAFDGQGKAGATPAAGLDNQIAILGIAAAHSAASAVCVGGIEAAVASSAALFTRANANGSLQVAGQIPTTADVAARADSQILPGGSSVGGASCRISASGVMSFGATSSGGVSSTSTAAGTFVALTQSEAGVPVDVLSSRAIDLTGSVVGRVANAAGIDGSVASGGLAGSVTHTDAEAQFVLGLQGHSRCALASSAQTDDILRVVSIMHAEASGAGNAAGEIGILGSAATLAAVTMACDATVTPAGVARSTIAVTAASQSETTIQHVARADTSAASAAQSDFAITGVIFGTSQAPLFAQAASSVQIGGFAKLDAVVSGAAEAGSSLDLVGASDGGGAVSGAGVSTVDLALNFAGTTVLPATAAYVVAIGGDTSVSVGLAISAADMLSMVGTSAVRLPISAMVPGRFTVDGEAACLSAVAVSAQGEISVTRTLITDIAISADANRTIVLNGQSVAQAASAVSTAIALMTVSGVTKAATLASSNVVATLGLSGDSAAEGSPASEMSGALKIGLSASVAAPRRAMSSAVFGVIASTAAVTDVASEASGDFATAGNAISEGEVKATASTAMAFARDVATETAIDATSTRAIAFGLDALAQVASATSSAGSASYHLATSAAVASRAHAADGLGLAGVVSANGGVNASGASAISVAGTSVSMAAVVSESIIEFTIASTGEADAEIIAVSTRSLPLAGDAAATVRLLADAVGGRLDLGLTVGAVSEARADASGAFSLAGIGRGNCNARAQASSVMVVTRSGAGDVSIVGQSDRVVTFLGHASVATATTAAANTTLPVTATASSAARLISTVVRASFSTSENSAAVIQIDASAKRALWQIDSASIAFLAPPSRRRGAFVSEQQGGRVLSKPQGGGIIPARINSAA